ncbi:MAG: proline dehydrogenase family protein [Bryobacteraceae bacterium]
MSRQRWLRRWLESSSAGVRIRARFVAGSTLDEAIAVCRLLQSEGILATLDHLGENVHTEHDADLSLTAALQALDRLEKEALPTTISIKLTQFGLDLDPGLCQTRIDTLAKTAAAADRKVEVDMESSRYTARTLDLVAAMHARHGNFRAVIQAYLRRSGDDVEKLNRLGIPVRLCKGAYLEGPSVAFSSKPDVDANYRRLMRLLLIDGSHPAIATHDEVMIKEALEIAANHNRQPDQFEFQMLYGVRRQLQRQIVKGNHQLRVYVPYGEAWYPYFMRRLAERPANLWFAIRQMVSG